ncbi:MAG TPA: dihydrofolate reductase family protein [Candidatus Saccharimonadales bacterium]|jgi:riboflavin biosynthesis pyrimidine reductase
MKVIMLNTMSANGMICRPDRSEGFLSHEGGEYVTEQAKRIGNIIWGRQAYENVKQNLPRFDVALRGVRRVIVSRNPDAEVAEGYDLARSPQAALDLLASLGMELALLDGGSSLNSSFLSAGLVDEVHLVAEPMLIGNGLSVVSELTEDVKLNLLSFEPIHQGEVLLKYGVVK